MRNRNRKSSAAERIGFRLGLVSLLVLAVCAGRRLRELHYYRNIAALPEARALFSGEAFAGEEKTAAADRLPEASPLMPAADEDDLLADMHPLCDPAPAAETAVFKAQEESLSAEAERQMAASLCDKLRRINPEAYGWLRLPGTGISYPVAAAGKYDYRYYETHLFDGSRGGSGMIFLDRRCTPDADILLIYGHHMKNGSMFKELAKYTDPVFANTHSVLYLVTEAGVLRAKLLAAAELPADSLLITLEPGTGASDMNHWREMLSSRNLLPGIPEYSGSGPLVVLVTCSYSFSGARLLVAFGTENTSSALDH